jgi:small subunit ribosomal protein S3
MGHKVHPYGLRVGIIKDWSSQWFAKKNNFPGLVYEDNIIRKYIKKNFAAARISKVDIVRSGNKVKVVIYSARPGVIIGRRGADIDRLREDLQAKIQKEIFVDIKEIKNPAIDAQLISENIALQVEKRIMVKRAMKKSMQQAIDAGAKGIKIRCRGRLDGSEMSRRETYMMGSIPLHTLRADIDYGFSEALTTYGLIGIKVWVYTGDIIGTEKNPQGPVVKENLSVGQKFENKNKSPLPLKGGKD